MTDQDHAPLSQASKELLAIFSKKDKDGNYIYDRDDWIFAREFFLLEIVRRGETDILPDEIFIELLALFADIGITQSTPSEQVSKLVKAYFDKKPVNPFVLEEIGKIAAKNMGEIDDLEGADHCAEAYKKLSGTTLTAPQEGDKAPENSENAQTLAQQLGIKVRI